MRVLIRILILSAIAFLFLSCGSDPITDDTNTVYRCYPDIPGHAQTCVPVRRIGTRK